MFTLRYVNARAEREWLELRRSARVECAIAGEILSQKPTTPTVRCFPFGSASLRFKIFRGVRYPQWVYLVSKKVQVYYLVDAQKRIVWLRRVVHHDFKGVTV